MTTANKLQKQEKWSGLLFITPMMLGFLVFVFIPIAAAIVISLYNWTLITDSSFIGLDNYKEVLTHDPTFWKVFKNTFVFSAGLVPFNISLALILAVILKQRLFGIGFFRTAFFTPVVTSMVVWAIVWKYIFATENGFVNQMLSMIGIEGPAWLYNVQLTMPVVILISALKTVGMNMVIFLAALHNVPALYYESAKIDGASRWVLFSRITLPLITPSIFMVLILTLVGSLKVFGQIYVVTQGGPGTSTSVLVYYIYMLAFQFYKFGYASAVAFILFFIILCLTIFQWQVRKRWVHYEQ